MGGPGVAGGGCRTTLASPQLLCNSELSTRTQDTSLQGVNIVCDGTYREAGASSAANGEATLPI
jgi:hypothetical protein